MFKRNNAIKSPRVSFTFEGCSIDAAAGDTIASALMLAGETHFRNTPVSQSERGPFCLMGVCFECLVEVDGIPNRQACMVSVREGMKVRRQKGAIGVEIE
ncbi:(2Fe-2S)-binding protein [uncultured Nitratireductor sp.]|uniref:(2Fe-2S)-binding protein n=1 Tax=uncultured Nitratireductor sp. TaxID=520953 RepID=UPI0025FEC761|nr:(2Fe-2S)-binding protein [uncultured Nitratireductor sp.]